LVNARLNLFAGSSPVTSKLTTNQGETMTLTVQDLVTRLDDFSDDALVLAQTSFPFVIRQVTKNEDGNVVLIADTQIPEFKDEESEDKEIKILGYPSNQSEDEE
jgi:hypothetical protein